MAHEQRAVDAFLNEVLSGRLGRRQMAQRALALGLSLPALATLLRERVAAAQPLPAPPDASRRPHIYTTPLGPAIDPYRWLEDPDDPEVVAYLEAENRYTEAAMAPTTELQEALYRELTGRIQQTDTGVPTPWRGYLYYSRTEEGRDYAIICRRRDTPDAPEEVLLDLNLVAGDYLDVGMWLPSPDNRYLAYNLDETGSELYTLFVLDLETGQVVDQVPLVWDFQWANDNRTLFYAKQDPEAVWPYWHHRHELGDDPAADPQLFEERNREFELATRISKDRAYIFLYTEAVDTNEVRYLPADRPTEEPKLFAPRRPGVRNFLEHHSGEFLVRTDEDAPNYKLMAVSAADPARGPRREVVPHRHDAVLDYIEVLERYLVLFGRDQGFSQSWVHDLTNSETTPIPFDEAVYIVAPGSNWEFASSKLRLLYSSPVTPDTHLEIDLTTGKRATLKQSEVVGGHDPSRYVSERVFATAPDGTRVPISVVYLREAPAGTPPGPRPLRLDGYGAYGTVTEPWFSILRLTLIDRGITFAQAHVRGGGELGRRWWDEGRLLNKWNTFTDFITCAEHLVAEGYTSPDRMIARGGSAGGLLMGVVATQRPDLFKVVSADVPAVEVIGGLMRSTNGRYQWPELGDPHDPAAYEYMRSYSPYETARSLAYPTMLVTAGLQDRRVVYWEPAKWVARLRDVMTGDNLLLLRTDMGAGHFGATGFENSNREAAFLYAFFLTALGMEGTVLDAPALAVPRATRRT
jgi:oligopeptidase B